MYFSYKFFGRNIKDISSSYILNSYKKNVIIHHKRYAKYEGLYGKVV